MSYIITAEVNTWLTKEPKMAIMLDANKGEKHQVKEGQVYQVKSEIQKLGKRIKVEIDYEAGTWWFYSPHWRIEPVDDREEAEQITDKHKELLEPVKPQSVNWSDNDSRVSRYFRVFEVIQNDPRRIPTNQQVIQRILSHAMNLDKVREDWQKYLRDKNDFSTPAIAVTSWYRPEPINRQVGGVRNSRHTYGDASDTYPVNGKLWEYQRFLDEIAWTNKALGYGAPRGFVHLDERKGKIRWNY